LTFRQAWVILLVTSILAIILSIPYIVLGRTVEPQGAEAAQEIYNLSPSLGNTVTALIRVLGLSYLASGVLGTAISATAFRKGEMWAWYALWIFPFFFAADIVNNLSISGTGWIADVPFLVLISVTLLVSPQFKRLVRSSAKS
jgi:hypothetical protein